MDKENSSNQDVTNDNSQIQEQEALLAKENERLENLKKAVAEATEKANSYRTQLKSIREDTKTAKETLSEGIEPTQTVNPDSAIQQLERIKESNRKKAFQKFFADNPDIASNEEKVNLLVDRYNRLKSSEEFDTQDVLQDLQSAYYSIEGANLLNRKANESFAQEQFSNGARMFSGTPSTEKSHSLTNADLQVVRQGLITPERILELKKKGFLD